MAAPHSWTGGGGGGGGVGVGSGAPAVRRYRLRYSGTDTGGVDFFPGLKRDVTQRYQNVSSDRSLIFLNVPGPG